jgi:hypothetical protein
MSWLRRWTPELAVTAAVFAGTLFAVLSDRADPPHHAAIGWVLTVLCCAAVFFRRRYPLGVAGLTLVCCALYYPLTDPDGLVLLAFAYTLYNAAAAGRIRSWWPRWRASPPGRSAHGAAGTSTTSPSS